MYQFTNLFIFFVIVIVLCILISFFTRVFNNEKLKNTLSCITNTVYVLLVILLAINSPIYSELHLDRPNDIVYVKSKFPIIRTINIAKAKDIEKYKIEDFERYKSLRHYSMNFILKNGNKISLQPYCEAFYINKLSKNIAPIDKFLNNDVDSISITFINWYNLLIIYPALIFFASILFFKLSSIYQKFKNKNTKTNKQ